MVLLVVYSLQCRRRICRMSLCALVGAAILSQCTAAGRKHTKRSDAREHRESGNDCNAHLHTAVLGAILEHDSTRLHVPPSSLIRQGKSSAGLLQGYMPGPLPVARGHYGLLKVAGIVWQANRQSAQSKWQVEAYRLPTRLSLVFTDCQCTANGPMHCCPQRQVHMILQRRRRNGFFKWNSLFRCVFS